MGGRCSVPTRHLRTGNEKVTWNEIGRLLFSMTALLLLVDVLEIKPRLQQLEVESQPCSHTSPPVHAYGVVEL